MAGMRWRSCVVLLTFFAWQACGATELVNLLEPHISEVAPYEVGYRLWPDFDISKILDHDESTFVGVRQLGLELHQYHPIAATHYRIKMAAHVDPSEYPNRWKVFVRTSGGLVRQTIVMGAKFENGVFEAPLEFLPGDDGITRRIRIDFLYNRGFAKWRDYEIAEFQLLGPRKALNALWPFGKYPCAERFGFLTTEEGPTGELFYAAKNERDPEVLRAVFSPAEDTIPREPTGFRGSGWRFEYGGAVPVVILGAEFPERPMVREVAVDAWLVGANAQLRKMVVEGHMCEPSCDDKLGTNPNPKGWVPLAKQQIKFSPKFAPRLQIETPGSYKAYRIKFYPRTFRNGEPQSTGITFGGIYFLGCTA